MPYANRRERTSTWRDSNARTDDPLRGPRRTTLRAVEFYPRRNDSEIVAIIAVRAHARVVPHGVSPGVSRRLLFHYVENTRMHAYRCETSRLRRLSLCLLLVRVYAASDLSLFENALAQNGKSRENDAMGDSLWLTVYVVSTLARRDACDCTACTPSRDRPTRRRRRKICVVRFTSLDAHHVFWTESRARGNSSPATAAER